MFFDEVEVPWKISSAMRIRARTMQKSYSVTSRTGMVRVGISKERIRHIGGIASNFESCVGHD